MAVRQITESVQNDGNYCQLDLQDLEFQGPLMRIETFRCSQPKSQYGITRAGTTVEMLAGQDHLSSSSNRIFRHVFSVGRTNRLQVTLEIREMFDEDGSWEVRTRDLDPESATFGWVLVSTMTPASNGDYHLHYEVRSPRQVTKTIVTSPLPNSITQLVSGLADIGSSPEDLGTIVSSLKANPLNVSLNWRASKDEVDQLFADFTENFQQDLLMTWTKNVRVYERFGDFRDKCVHPGVNLTGPHIQLASEFMFIRAYRSSLIALGRVFDPEMAGGGLSLWDAKEPLHIDTKPGVYAVFLNAYLLNVGIYQLGLDKVHSDYGGVPMALAPGSKLETGISPIASAARANQTLAEVAFAFYVTPGNAVSSMNLAKDKDTVTV